MILLSPGRRWSRTEAFGEVARQDRGEARWGQDRGEWRHSIVFGIWESVFCNWGVFGGIELNLRPIRSWMRVILQFITHCPMDNKTSVQDIAFTRN